MERRKFLKFGLLTIPSMYLFPDKLLGRGMNAASRSGKACKQDIRMPDVYSGIMDEDNILMPEELLSIISMKEVHVVAPENEDIIVLISGNDIKNGLLKDIEAFNRINTEGPFCHAGLVGMSEEGRVGIPDKIKKVSDIGVGKVSVVHLRKEDLINLDDTGLFRSKIDAGFSEDARYYVDNFEFFIIGPA